MYQQIDFTKLKVLNYNRKSSEDEDRQMLSVTSQIDEANRISEFYKLQPFVEIFQESKSAKMEHQRPEFARMMKMIKDGKGDCIVCWKLDRLARNMTEGGQIIDMLSSGIIKAIITNDKVFYPWDNVIVMSVEFSQGKQFIKDLSTNVKRGQKKKASLGVPHGVSALGFLNDKREEKGNRNWVVDEDRLWKIKKLFELFLTGTYSAGKLHTYAVNELKLTTVQRKRSGGQPIALSRIYEILKDSIYTGFFEYGGEKYVLNKDLPRIITESQRIKVLQLLSKKNISKSQHHESLYSGFIKSSEDDFIGQDIKFQLICDCKHKFAYRNKTHCPKCDREVSKLDNPKYLIKSYYYNVRKKKYKLPYKSISEDTIKSELKKHVIDNLDFSNDLLSWSKEYIHELKDKEVDEKILITKDREKRKNEFELKKRRMREMMRDGQINTEEYTEDIEILKNDYKDINEPIKEDDWYKDMLEITDILSKINETMEFGTYASKRVVLSQISSNLVWNDEKLSIYSKKTIQTLINGVKSIKSKYPEFEPSNYVVPQGSKEKTPLENEVFSTMLLR